MISDRISVVIPTLDEAETLPSLLRALEPLRARGHEVIVADGGSSDRTRELAAACVDCVVEAPRGRARQMNAGARRARGAVLWFLHADSAIPANADEAIMQGLKKSGRVWGRFDVRLSGASPLFRMIAMLMNLRSRLTGIATGDQGIFVRRETFEAVGRFPNIALMEDIAISRALKHFGRPLCLHERLVTSSRRWEAAGIVSTILLMWRLRLAYFLGADPAKLARRYRAS